MSYTATYDASHKVTQSGAHAKNFIRHVFRDVDEKNGFAYGHSNKGIDPSRTHLNISFVKDSGGGFLVPKSSDEVLEVLKRRIKTVKPQVKKDGSPKPLRKDAVVMRPLILQLDPKFWNENFPDWAEKPLDENDDPRFQKFIEAQIEWAKSEFGAENVIGGSLHMDEYSPQLQLLITPVTDDGRLSQRDFFKGPGDIKRQHMEYRQKLQSVGYDVDFSVSDRSKEHLSANDYKARKYNEELKALEQMRDVQVSVWDARKGELDARESSINEREGLLAKRERSVNAREAELKEREAKASSREQSLIERESKVKRLSELSQERSQDALELYDLVSKRDGELGDQYRALGEAAKAVAKAYGQLPPKARIDAKTAVTAFNGYLEYLRSTPEGASVERMGSLRSRLERHNQKTRERDSGGLEL